MKRSANGAAEAAAEITNKIPRKSQNSEEDPPTALLNLGNKPRDCLEDEQNQ